MESQPEDTSQPSVGESNNVTESNIEIEMSKDIPDKVEIEETSEDNSKRKQKSKAWNHFKRVKVEGGFLGFFPKIKCCIAITTNMWTSSNNKGFMAVIGYFIDDNWTLQNCILRFSYVPPPHTTEVLADTLVEALMDWNIDCKVSTSTVDNCTTNNAMINHLLQKLPTKDMPLDGKGVELVDNVIKEADEGQKVRAGLMNLMEKGLGLMILIVMTDKDAGDRGAGGRGGGGGAGGRRRRQGREETADWEGGGRIWARGGLGCGRDLGAGEGGREDEEAAADLAGFWRLGRGGAGGRRRRRERGGREGGRRRRRRRRTGKEAGGPGWMGEGGTGAGEKEEAMGGEATAAAAAAAARRR
ncbi:UNVERIFIED_CONTAM: hypothetical protein Scaly_2253500 [Sesamum calycinum]|uniref:Uncharacterized protein n=1 Tax=Sesamum calycinum TaxID=2727403 RepID=A0AAW2MBG5_9LAMI